MIYLDSAATSLQKPPEVARAVVRAMQSCASPGRGDHAAAMRSTKLFTEEVMPRFKGKLGLRQAAE